MHAMIFSIFILSDHKFTFTLPSLVYPDGRFYIDLDGKELMRYMRALGIPDEYLRQIVPKRRSPPGTGPSLFQMEDVDGIGSSRESMTQDSSSSISKDGMEDMLTEYDVDEDVFATPQQLFNVAPLKFPFHHHKTQIREEVKSASHRLPAWVMDAEEEDLQFGVQSVVKLDETAQPKDTSFLNPLDAGDEQAAFRSLKASDKKKTSSGRNSLDRFSESIFDASLHSRPSLHGYGSNEPFKPLDAPWPLEASPRIQWVINFIGGSNFEQCRQRARE